MTHVTIFNVNCDINLRRLDLTNNQLSSLPVAIGNLINLEILYLHTNQLSSLPATIGNLINLEVLYLENNQLSSLPATIGNLIDLQLLYLHNNQLNSLPATIGNLINLTELCLLNNQLSSLPSEILNIKKNINIDETSYEINNLDIECTILIFHRLNNNIQNLPINIKEIWLNNYITNPNIKLPFGCEIKIYCPNAFYS